MKIKNLLVKITLIVTLVITCNSASAAFSDSPSTYALWHCDATNWADATETTPDDNLSGRTAKDLQINAANEVTLMPGSPYGGSYLAFDGTDHATANGVLDPAPTDLLKIDVSFRAHSFPAAGLYKSLVWTYPVKVYLYNGANVLILTYDAAGNPHFLSSTKTINVDTWYSINVSVSDGTVEVIVGNDAEGYVSNSGSSGTGLLDASSQNQVTVGWDFFGGGREVNADLDEIRISTPNIIFTDIPKNMQVCPRLLSTNYANVKIAGTVLATGYDYIIAKVYRETVLQAVLTQSLVYSAGKANFNLSPTIKAELANYNLIIALLNGSTENVVANVNNVVAGDVYIINGQSNALALNRFGSSANANIGPFLRSFGTHHEIPSLVAADLSWHQAEGDLGYAQASVGQWAIRMGRVLIDETGIPIAIINNANSGKAISFFQRNNANHEDLNTNYGRLLYRVRQAGVENNVRAILWYQGESDGGNAPVHKAGMINLYNDWSQDYPGFEKAYIHQLKVGCGVSQWDIALRNSQRLLPDTYPKFVVMSTTAPDSGPDNCHYTYINGYEVIGRQDAYLILRDLYGAAINDVEPPNVDFAFFNDTEQKSITVVMRNKIDTLTWQSGAQNYFLLLNSSASIISGTVSGNAIVLQLNSSGSGNNGLIYSGGMGVGIPGVLNKNGVGLLDFYVPVNNNIPEPSLLLSGLVLGLAFLRRK